MIKLTEIRGVGRATLPKLARLGISSTEQLLLHLPRRYDDFSQIIPIAELRAGAVSIQARIESIEGRYVRRGLHITIAVLADDTGRVKAVWFNQPYLKRQLKIGQEYFFSGTYSFERGQYQLMTPNFERVSRSRVQTARVLPVYPETKGLTSKQLRRFIAQAVRFIGEIPSDMPDELAAKYFPLSYHEALQLVHMPDDIETAEAARERLAFGELVALSLSAIDAQKERLGLEAVPVNFYEEQTKSFVSRLPFTLTADQRRAAWEILKDLDGDAPMNRLLDGDVGSGKTVVAALVILNIVLSAKQVAFIAPTTLLAEQHLTTLKTLFDGHDVRIEILLGKTTSADKKRIKSLLKKGEIDVLVGTHAMLEPDVEFNNLALIIIDEQHRFGVEQRRKIQTRLGLMPHVLTMSATPIPRSLALTLYGELDISLIKTMPEARKPITTELLSSSARRQVNDHVSKELEKGHQVYVVTPLISESEALAAISAEEASEMYRKNFSAHRVELLHGRLKEDEKSAVMKRFKDGLIDILISTTVVEVGVDVPNATLMVVEGAERFGLAQLHQLRGRVGRSEHASTCILVVSGALKPPKRLQAVLELNSGFELAELDLELRGAGAIYGVRQSGTLDLKIATLSDAVLAKKARRAAREFHESGADLLQYPQMAAAVGRFSAITNLN